MTGMTDNTQASATSKLLVGVDASDNAMRAVEWAAAEAAARNAPLTLVHAISVQGVASFDAGRFVGPAREEGHSLLRRIIERVRTRNPDLDLRAEVTDMSPAHALTELSREAALIVTGTRGHGGFAGMLVGSVSRKLAAHAHCPLAVVRGDLPTETLDEVVLGVEPGQAAAPIRYAFDAAARYGALLHAVRVWHPHAIYSSVAGGYCEDLDQTRADEIGAMEDLLAPLAAEHPDVKVEASAGRGNTVPVLIEAARGTRLLVVGAHRHRGPLAVGAGYVVDGLLAHATTPIAVVPIG